MSLSSPISSLVFVQGSFQTPLVYDTLERRLQSQGFSVNHPNLPSLPSLTSVDEHDYSTQTLDNDTSVVHEEVSRLVEDQGETVAIVMHSYGGLVGSNAVPKELAYSERHAKGLHGGVAHLIYIAAFLLPVGQSVLGAFGESPNNDVKANGSFIIKNGSQTLYNGLHKDEASIWESRLIHQSYGVQTTKLSRAAHTYVPSTYIICERDQAAPPQYQEMFAHSAQSQIIRLDSDHSPMLSQPEGLARTIAGIITNLTSNSLHS